MKIKALKNFGFGGENVVAGTELEVKPEDFGGTYQDFKSAGFFEEIGTPALSVVSGGLVSGSVAGSPVGSVVEKEPKEEE
jgi:hypothetical protein